MRKDKDKMTRKDEDNMMRKDKEHKDKDMSRQEEMATESGEREETVTTGKIISHDQVETRRRAKKRSRRGKSFLQEGEVDRIKSRDRSLLTW